MKVEVTNNDNFGKRKLKNEGVIEQSDSLNATYESGNRLQNVKFPLFKSRESLAIQKK